MIANELKEGLRDTMSATSLKWGIGILIVILGGTFWLLWDGQSQNRMKILETQEKIRIELKALSSEVNDLTKVVIRIDERTKPRTASEENDKKIIR